MSHFCTSGNVSIAPDAVIAAGSVLKADSGGAIVVGAGACLGLGSILHAHGGAITVEAGASLGAGTLVVGQCSIGAQACVGASTTIYNVSIAPGQLIPAGSLLGSLGPSAESSAESSAQATGSDTVDDTTEKHSSAGNSAEASIPKADRMEPEPSPWDDVETAPPAASTSSTSTSSSRSTSVHAKTVVYGRAQFEEMKRAMFSR